MDQTDRQIAVQERPGESGTQQLVEGPRLAGTLGEPGPGRCPANQVPDNAVVIELDVERIVGVVAIDQHQLKQVGRAGGGSAVRENAVPVDAKGGTATHRIRPVSHHSRREIGRVDVGPKRRQDFMRNRTQGDIAVAGQRRIKRDVPVRIDEDLVVRLTEEIDIEPQSDRSARRAVPSRQRIGRETGQRPNRGQQMTRLEQLHPQRPPPSRPQDTGPKRGGTKGSLVPPNKRLA